MLNIHIRIINVLSSHEYKYGSDIIREAKVDKKTVFVHLSQLEDWGYIESKEGKSAKRFFVPQCKYKLTEEGLKRKTELESKTAYLV